MVNFSKNGGSSSSLASYWSSSSAALNCKDGIRSWDQGNPANHEIGFRGSIETQCVTTISQASRSFMLT